MTKCWKFQKDYLDWCLSNGQWTENLLQQMAQDCSLCLKVSNPGPFVATNIQLISHNSNMNKDIFLKFLTFVYHMFLLNWQKILAVAQSGCQLRPILAQTWNGSNDRICWDFWNRKKTGAFLDQFQSPIERNFDYLEKKWRFAIFQTTCGSRW